MQVATGTTYQRRSIMADRSMLDCLSKGMLTELKSLSKPPAGVDVVTACCLMMVENEFKDHSW